MNDASLERFLDCQMDEEPSLAELGSSKQGLRGFQIVHSALSPVSNLRCNIDRHAEIISAAQQLKKMR